MAVFHSDWYKIPKQVLNPSRSSGKVFNERLAKTIRQYWASHGFDVYVATVPMFDRDNSYTLVSELKNGLPIGATVGAARVPV